MSYANPIDTAIVQEVLDDLEDNNAHTLVAMLASTYGLPGGVPQGVLNRAYRSAQWVIEDWRIQRWKSEKEAGLTPPDLAGECPNHGGAFDCTPFCSLCEGTQEVVGK